MPRVTRVTRRQFLDEAFFVAQLTGLAAAGLIDLTAPAAEATPARSRVAPSDTVRVACVGLHGRGMDHLRGYLGLPGVTVVAVCDIDEAVAQKAAAAIVAHNPEAKPKVYTDLRKLYEDKDIDAVSLAMPIHWHALAAIWAMQAGKDVYVEKPVCHNVSEGRRMVQAAAHYGRICQAGTQSRSNKATRDAIQYIHDGKIGTVTLARGLCYKPRASIGIKPDGPVPPGVDYDIWLGPAPKRPFNPNRFHYNWHWNWDYGAGDLGNQGIHQMDIARWALGKDRLPDAVYAFGGRYGYEDQGETPNTDLAVYDWGENGKEGRILFEVRGLKTEGLKDVHIGDIIYGSNGYVVMTANYGAVAAFDKGGKPTETFKGGGNHFGNFIAAVRSRKQAELHAPVSEGHLSSALCHLGNVSYRLGAPAPFAQVRQQVASDRDLAEALNRMSDHLAADGVDLTKAPCKVGRKLRLDAKKETITGDAEAAALLTRPYRAPFLVPEHIG